jgi:Ca-activated chloride channel family protein
MPYHGARLLLSFWCALAGMAPANGQSDESEPRVSITPRLLAAPASVARSKFHLNVNLILVPATVTDLRDRPVLGLEKKSFRVFEDDVEQQIATFSMADGPVSAGIVFDGSQSMATRIEKSRAAVEQFFRTSVPGDEFFLVRFSDRADLVTRWTSESDDISRELIGIRPKGWTAMIDGIRLSMEEMRTAHNPRRVLLVISDGADNNSRYSESELLSLLREADVRVCAIGLFERPRYLQRLAYETGGKVIWVHKLPELSDAIERLSLQIRNEYVIGYSSDHAQNDGRYHKVRIELQLLPEARQLHVTWRQGYVSP